MTFVLTGFFQDGAYRVFSFDGVNADRRRDSYWVRADLNAVRECNIQVQELPLLCRGVLERRARPEQDHTLTYTRAEMAQHRDAQNLAAERRKAPHRFRAKAAPVQ